MATYLPAFVYFPPDEHYGLEEITMLQSGQAQLLVSQRMPFGTAGELQG